VSARAEDPSPDVNAVLAILSRPDDVDLNELVELVARICDSAAAGVTIQRGGKYHVPVTHGIEPLVCASDDTFCRATMSTDGIYVVEDAKADPEFSSTGFVDGSLADARFYASAPLYAPSGQMVGRLCVIDPEPKTLTPLQRRALETLALSVTKLIELRLLRERPAPSAPDAGQAAATVVSQLAAEVSHDMRVPLSAIVAGVEMLAEELQDHPDQAVGALLSRTDRAANRLSRMLDQHMEFGGFLDTPRPQEVDLGKVLEQLKADTAAMLETADATIETGELPMLQADPDDMYSVLLNLVTNSLKFARPDVPPIVRIESRRTEDAWRVSVRDNGVGIPEHRRRDVFSLFSRVDDGVSGYGIGLATVARIIAAHGGRVGAEEAPEGGTEMWFEVPTSNGSGAGPAED
jgi:signal transduction histidine kinase